MRKIFLLLISLVFGTFSVFGTLALAQEDTPGFGSISEDSKEPIEISANQLEFNDETGMATFKGEVLIIQGNLQLIADFVEVMYSEDRSKIDS